MWARVVETMFACWLAISPLVFRGAEASPRLWTIDLAAAGLIATLALASYWRPMRHAHLGIIVVALALVGLGMLAPVPPSPSDQNHILTGLLLLLFAIVPNAASQPPESWESFDSRPRH